MQERAVPPETPITPERAKVLKTPHVLERYTMPDNDADDGDDDEDSADEDPGYTTSLHREAAAHLATTKRKP